MTDLPTRSIDLKAVLSGSSPTVAMADHSEGMSYLQSVPRRIVTLYLPLSIIVIILLFPFYWMGLTAIKPDEQLLDLDKFNPFWTWNPTFKHIHKLLFESYCPWWLWNTMYVAVSATVLSIIASVLAAYAIVRLRYRGAQWVGGLIFLAYLVPPSIPGLISAFIFCFTLCWNEFIYALTFLQSVQNKTVPVAIVNEFVDGDIYRWGSLMAGALAGSLPLVILYAFFVEHYVSAMT